jgi:hypothetical protein
VNQLSSKNNWFEVQDFKRNTDRFRGIYRTCLKLMKRTQKIRTCNRLHLGKRGFWLIVPKNLPKSRLVWGPIWVILVHCRKQVQRHPRATFHTRLRAHDHYTSSTLIGGKRGDGPCSLHTTLEGPTEFVTARWMSSLHGFLHDIKWIMFHNHLDYFKYPWR